MSEKIEWKTLPKEFKELFRLREVGLKIGSTDNKYREIEFSLIFKNMGRYGSYLGHSQKKVIGTPAGETDLSILSVTEDLIDQDFLLGR